MVLIRHVLGKKALAQHVKEDVRFLLTNKYGSYVSFPTEKYSRYDGFFVFNSGTGIMLKIVDDLTPETKQVIEVINRFWCVERELLHLRERFFMPYHFNALVYETDAPHVIELVLDVRDSYAMPKFGRHFKTYEDDGVLIIEYSLEEQNGGESGEGKPVFLALHHDGKYKLIDSWFEKEYPFDRERNSSPYSSYVYASLQVMTGRLIVAVADTKEKARDDALHIAENRERLMEQHQKLCEKRMGFVHTDKDVEMAFNASLHALAQLSTQEGIMAGLPWFFQYWTRDMALALGGDVVAGNIHKAKTFLLSLLKEIRADGNLPIHAGRSGGTAADAVGWVFRRLSDLVTMYGPGIFMHDELVFIIKKLEYALERLEKEHCTPEGFLVNGPKETWMDSEHNGDDRQGIRIEIQALMLSMYRLMLMLGEKKQVYAKKEEHLRNLVRERFFYQGCLKDGIKGKAEDGADDMTIRPNLFLAAYCYPELLHEAEWARCFELVLKKLWLPWGGISSIDQEHPLFCKEHTGEFPQSYHRGDSWFFVNNLAALVMHRVDAQRFKEYVEKILSASTTEILYQGTIGHHAELSSAHTFRSQGCPAQAWSSSSYIELVHELFGHGNENRLIREKFK